MVNSHQKLRVQLPLQATMSIVDKASILLNPIQWMVYHNYNTHRGESKRQAIAVDHVKRRAANPRRSHHFQLNNPRTLSHPHPYWKSYR